MAFFKKTRNINWKQKGQDASSFVMQASAELSKVIIENDKKKAKDKLAGVELLTYTTAFFFIVCDREAQAEFELSEEDSKSFADGILFEVGDGLAKLWNNPNEIMLTVIKVLNDDIHKLQPFALQLIAGKDESRKGTLCWEFGRMLVQDFSVDPAVAANLGYVEAIRLATEAQDFIRGLLSN